MAEILCIEEESFEFPWADTDFTRCLRQRNCIGMVAEISGGVVGYMLYELHRTKVHILNFDKKIYNQTITVSFYKRIRDEKKFIGLEELTQQLEKDKKVIKQFFGLR